MPRKPTTWDGFFTALQAVDVPQDFLSKAERAQGFRADFIAHGLRSRDEARRTGDYADADDVAAVLQRRLDDARARLLKPGK